MKLIALVLAVLVMSASAALPSSLDNGIEVPSGAWGGTAQWVILGFNLTATPDISLNLSFQLCCTSNLYRILWVLAFSEKDPGGSVGIVGSDAGWHASIQAADERLLFWEFAPFGATPSPVGTTMSGTLSQASLGNWSWMAFLGTEPGEFKFNASVPPSWLTHGVSGVRALYPRHFQATLDAELFAGAGAGYTHEVEVSQGMLGFYDPWGPYVEYHHGWGTYEGPGTSGSCIRTPGITAPPIGGCGHWNLRGAPGPWKFWKSSMAEALPGLPWLVYVDAEFPTY